MSKRVRLHINVDHVATLRQARGTRYPDPVHAAILCERAGADGITVHLREDRRHIQDRDVYALREVVHSFLNLEMANTREMVDVAKKVKPELVTLVPERREERTTEGGLDVAGQLEAMRRVVAELKDAGIPVSFFVGPERRQIDAAIVCGAHSIEMHTGDFAHAVGAEKIESELKRLSLAADHASKSDSLVVAAGHGLTVRNTLTLMQNVAPITELNIGHAVISDAVMIGLEGAVKAFIEAIDRGVLLRNART